MRILLTNDDGIHAPGLKSLEKIARELSDDVWVVAPETDQSGVAHSLSLNDPLRLRQISERHFAVKGTPTDCVLMGVRKVLGGLPDLVLSGVNRGQNIAEDVTYSGTVAAAMEGTLLGVPSIALSQAYGWTSRDNPNWACCEAHGAGIIRRLLASGIPDGVLMNVNFPDRTPETVAGVVATRQGWRGGDSIGVEERRDGRFNPYYWLVFQRAKSEPAEGTDLRAVLDGFISVTPLRLDLTDHALRERLAHDLR